jgi:hypothetical protein
MRVLLTLVAAILIPSSARAQVSQFHFDQNGNLTVQANAVAALPHILGQPQPQIAAPGRTASFSVVVADARDLSYQWRYYGTNLPAATSGTFLLTNVSALNEGLYSVVLSNPSGSITSAPAMLWIDSDGDGLPDSWEQTYFGNLTRNPTGDFDGDGISNLDEFNDDTNPTNSASAQFRLVVLSDGGLVSVSPMKLSYTNGEMVTLTATAIAPEIFHGWTGEIIATTNQVSLTMTNNKTLVAYFQPQLITWASGTSGSWHNPSNWNPTLVPTAVDEVVLPNNVTVSVNSSAECRSFTLTSGTLDGTGTLTIHGDSFWFSGTMSGSGRTIITPGATFTINSSSTPLTLSRPLENGGTVNWTGIFGMNVNNVAITNRAGALFNIQNAVALGSGGGSPRFDNAGTFLKSTNGGTTTFNIPFNNYGTVDIQSGTLLHNGSFINNGSVTLAAGNVHWMGGGGSGSGAFNAPATASVNWVNSGFTLNPGTQLDGAGLYRIVGATVSFDTDLVVQNLEQIASGFFGTFTGSGTVTISNSMAWSSGTMGGTGRTIVAPGATLTINPANTLNLARPLENGGTVNWTGILGMNVNNLVIITNRAGALFHVQNAPSFSGGGSARFDNAGTFRKSGSSGNATLGFPFNNYADVDIQTGALVHNSSFMNNGSVLLASGTAHWLAGGGSGSGAFNNPINSSVTWAGGAFTLNPGAQLNGGGLYRIYGSTVSFDTDLVVQNLEQIAGAFFGTFAGSGTVTISNSMAWSSGTMSGTGRTIIAPGATLTINPTTGPTLSRPLENGGTVIFAGFHGMSVNNAVITNRPGALFNVQNATTISSSGSTRFDNAGTFRKSVSVGTAALGFPFNNSGTIEIHTGTLNQHGSFLNNGSVALAAGTVHRIIGGGSGNGTFTNATTAVVEWTGSTYTLNPGAQLNGAGIYRQTGVATVNFATDVGLQNLELIGDLFAGAVTGSGTVTISNAMTWYTGTMSGSGRTIIAPGATLTINPTAGPTLSRPLENGGTVIFTGVHGMSVNNVVITNRHGALFNVQNATTISSSGSTRFDNAGTFRKSVSVGTAALGFPFNNYGTMEIHTGILALFGTFTATSDSRLNCALGGTTAGTGYGQLQKSGVIALNGALSVDLLPGFVPPTNSTYTVVSAGTLSGSFSNFTYPSNRVTLSLSNSPTSVILRAIDVFPIPQPVLLTPQLLGSNALLTWTATSNVTYRLENKADIGSTNWIAVPGDVTTLSNTASKLDALTTSNRFYRVRALP